jgi:hypothetical protein
MRNWGFYLAVVTAELEAQGHLNERGKRYAATAISRMLVSSAPATRRDAWAEAIARHPRFKLRKPSGRGFILPVKG